MRDKDGSDCEGPDTDGYPVVITVVVLSSWRRVTVPHDSPDDGYESQASGNESLMRILCVNLIVRGFGGGRIRVPCAWWTGGDET